MNTYQRIAGSAVCLLAALSVAACSSSGGSASKPGTVSADVKSPAAAPSASGVSADVLANQAVADLKAATSVRVQGQMNSGGDTASLDLQLVTGEGCSGSLATGSSGSFELTLLGQKLWVKPSAAFWKKAGIPASSAAIISGKWIGTTISSKAFGDFANFCDVQSMAAKFDQATGLTSGAVTTIDGQSAVAVTDPSDGSVAYISQGAKPHLLRLAKAGGDGGQIDFLDYDKPATIVAPRASVTLPGSKFGM